MCPNPPPWEGSSIFSKPWATDYGEALSLVLVARLPMHGRSFALAYQTLPICSGSAPQTCMECMVGSLAQCILRTPVDPPIHGSQLAACHGQGKAAPTAPHRLRLGCPMAVLIAGVHFARQFFLLLPLPSKPYRNSTGRQTHPPQSVCRACIESARREYRNNPIFHPQKVRASPNRHSYAYPP